MEGHMRSHFAKLLIPPKPFETANDNDDVVSAPPRNFDAAIDGGGSACSTSRASATAIGSPSFDSSPSSFDYIRRYSYRASSD
ncbi:uncharacterized protein G2W53_018716 [Senna tora]|uniref:Uncharacterized protein n=1 Tax=Senna tora TaxID=362788 RepID=A0A834TSW1_9FABA|nr:uncharacterized protein G2W53_018716 [Senna tora]